MSDEEALIDAGPEAVVRALGDDEGALNVDVLAQTCARRARASSVSREDALGWAKAAIACYRKTAEGRAPGYDRQGSEVPLFGLRGLMILRWGAEAGSTVLDPELLLQWIRKALDRHTSPAAFRDALGHTDGSDEHEHAVCLKERLQVGLPLFQEGLFPRALLPWFKEAGLLADE